jgi:hypothetical protein
MRISNPVSGYFESKRKESRKVDEAKRKQEEVLAKAKVLGGPETDLYLSGQTRPPQTKLLDESQQQAETAATDLYSKAGMQDTPMLDKEFYEIQLNRQVQEAAMNEQTWLKAVESLGFTSTGSLQLLAEYRQDARDVQSAFANLMGISSQIAMTMAMSKSRTNKKGPKVAGDSYDASNWEGLY